MSYCGIFNISGIIILSYVAPRPCLGFLITQLVGLLRGKLCSLSTHLTSGRPSPSLQPHQVSNRLGENGCPGSFSPRPRSALGEKKPPTARPFPTPREEGCPRLLGTAAGGHLKCGIKSVRPSALPTFLCGELRSRPAGTGTTGQGLWDRGRPVHCYPSGAGLRPGRPDLVTLTPS